MTAIVKRALDILIGATALLILLPIMLAIALWIRLDSRGPAFFIQQRIGRNLAPFRIYKFRTMLHRNMHQIDQVNEKVISSGTDVRITRIGRILRATSLDELPQLFNIINGTMSLVGPRPMIPEQLLAIPESKMGRFYMKPGVTGWSQVNGRRDLSWPDQLASDAWYADHASLWLDLKILFKTPSVVFKASGVYNNAVSNWRAYLPTKCDMANNSTKHE